MYVCMYVCMYVRMYMCVCVCIYMYVCVCVHVYAHTHTRTHALTNHPPIMHTYKNWINFSTIQQLLLFTLKTSYIFLQLLTSPHNFLHLLTTYIQLL